MILALGILAALGLASSAMLLYRRIHQQKVVRSSLLAAASGGISSVESITLGGIRQSILIQSQDQTKPVLLLLHGGPGMPAPGVSFRSADYAFATTTSELMKHYVLVFWDQRGSGKSIQKGSQLEPLGLEQLLSDAAELVDYLRDRFHTQKIYLGGLSWGTVLAMKLASRYPEKFHAYAAMAQIVNWGESDKICYEWNLKQAKEKNNQKALRELKSIGLPPYHDINKWLTLRKWNMQQGAFIYEDNFIKAPVLKLYFKTLLFSPDYSLGDVLRVFTKIKDSYPQRMIDDFAEIDFLSTVPKIDVPVYFFHGRHDHAIIGSITEDYYHKLIAPKGKQFIWLENSAHMFYPEDARKVENILIGLSRCEMEDTSLTTKDIV